MKGMNWATRKIAMKLTPTIVYTLESTSEIKVEFQTIVKNMSQIYTINGETEHRDYDGDLVTTTTRLDDEGKFIMTCVGKKIGPLRTVREFMENGHLKITTAVLDKNISCYRIFKRQHD